MTSVSISRTDRRDAVQQVALLAGGAIAVLGLAAGVGAFGGIPIGEIGDGDLAPDASLVVPAGVAFSIWTPIYAGLAGVALWQARPGRRDLDRLRAVGWPLLVSMLANAAWILAAQAQAYVLTVALILLILASLVLTYAGLLGSAPRSRTERVLLDGTVGLYLGWVSVATIANVSTTLVDAGYGDLVPGRTVWAVAMLAVAGALGTAVTLRGGRRLAFPAAVAWALAWVVLARLDAGPDRSVPAAATAAVAAATVVAAVARGRRNRR